MAPRLAAIERMTPRLADDERARATGITDPDQRQQWLAAHIALRLVLEHRIGPVIRGAPYHCAPGGRPMLAARPGPPPAAGFSLSHTDRFALIALAPDDRIGVDIEAHRPMRLSAPRIERLIAAGRGVLATGEQHLPASGPAGIRAWTRLEAFTKASGRSIWMVLKELDVGGGQVTSSLGTIATSAAALAAASHLVVHDVDLGGETDGHCAAIAMPRDLGLAGGDQRLKPAAQDFHDFLAAFEEGETSAK